MSEVALVVEFELKPGRRDEFVAHLKRHAKDTLTNVEGCLQFDVLVPMEAQFDAPALNPDPNHVFLYERYLDNQAFLDHVTSSRVANTRAGYSDLIVSRKIVRCRVT